MNMYDVVTNKIIQLLEEGTVPWKKPWKSHEGVKNLVSKKPYRGINQFLLNCAPYSSPYWLTFKQAKNQGGHIRKGEKSTLIVFWNWPNRENQIDEGEPTEDQNNIVKKIIPTLRHYNVFNLEQTEGIKTPDEVKVIERPFTQIKKAEDILLSMPNQPRIIYGKKCASYNPTTDLISLPDRTNFHSLEGFYSTAYHEVAHSTGHPSRLNRFDIFHQNPFGSHGYSQEELVAEFTAAILCAAAGIEQKTLTNSVAYIQGWLKVLKNNKKMAVLAAGKAQKAADYILLQPN